MTTKEKNIEISLMVGAILENWYTPNEKLKTSGDYLVFTKDWYPDGTRYHNDNLLKFDTDANWQFQAIAWIEAQDVINAEYASNYNVDSNCFGCSIETTGYKSFSVINIKNQNRKEAIFEALYLMSQYLKNK